VRYPATLITTADHDDRVVPAHSFKFTATLQAAQAGPAPILIRIERKAGHGAGKPTGKLIEELKKTGGVSHETRKRLAVEVYRHTAAYDAAIASQLPGMMGVGEQFPDIFTAGARKALDLRYGENPHQQAALYSSRERGIAGAEKLQGKELSYNNIMDADAALLHHAKSAQAVVATNDQALRQALVKQGSRVIFLRKLAFLAMTG
jgi:hypothetical protein